MGLAKLAILCLPRPLSCPAEDTRCVTTGDWATTLSFLSQGRDHLATTTSESRLSLSFCPVFGGIVKISNIMDIKCSGSYLPIMFGLAMSENFKEN